MSLVNRALPSLTRPCLLKSNVCCTVSSIRQKTNHPYIAPEWHHLDRREDYNGRKRWFMFPDSDRWQYYDQIVWPPHHTERGQPKKGEVFYMRERVKHSPLKLWYACQFVRNRSVDEAIKQLPFFRRKAADILAECIVEARKKAVEENKIEFPTNMYVAEAFAVQSMIVKGVRRHASNRWGEVKYRYSDVFVRLEEGPPPPEGSRNRWPTRTGWELMRQYIEQLRNRRIKYGL